MTQEWSVENYSVRGTDGVMEVTTNRLRFLSGLPAATYAAQAGKTTGWQEIDTGYDDPWVCSLRSPTPSAYGQAKEMISWIEGKSGHRGDARQARQTVEILMAIYQSARDHEVVKAPLLLISRDEEG